MLYFSIQIFLGLPPKKGCKLEATRGIFQDTQMVGWTERDGEWWGWVVPHLLFHFFHLDVMTILRFFSQFPWWCPKTPGRWSPRSPRLSIASAKSSRSRWRRSANKKPPARPWRLRRGDRNSYGEQMFFSLDTSIQKGWQHFVSRADDDILWCFFLIVLFDYGSQWLVGGQWFNV